MISELTGVESAYEIPDVLWDRIVSLLPLGKRKKKAGRPRMFPYSIKIPSLRKA